MHKEVLEGREPLRLSFSCPTSFSPHTQAGCISFLYGEKLMQIARTCFWWFLIFVHRMVELHEMIAYIALHSFFVIFSNSPSVDMLVLYLVLLSDSLRIYHNLVDSDMHTSLLFQLQRVSAFNIVVCPERRKQFSDTWKWALTLAFCSVNQAYCQLYSFCQHACFPIMGSIHWVFSRGCFISL